MPMPPLTALELMCLATAGIVGFEVCCIFTAVNQKCREIEAYEYPMKQGALYPISESATPLHSRLLSWQL